LTPREGFERARQLAQHALQLSPDLADAHARLQYIHLAYDWDWAAAETEGQRALAIDPTSLHALLVSGLLSGTLGRWNDSERQLRAALDRDPLSTSVLGNLGFALYRQGQIDKAETMYRKVLEIAPGVPWVRAYLANALVMRGKVDQALAIVQQETDEEWRLVSLPNVLRAAGRNSEADKALEAQIAHWAETGAFYVAETYAFRGDHDRALEWLERAYRQRDPALIEITGEPLFKSLEADPRFKAFLRKMNLPD
jgi:tetratricopeptide (TPR) repeat protein